MEDTVLVRLKAYNRKKGHVLRRYTYRGIRFQAGRGWYRVDPDVARYLECVHQIPDDEDSPLAFDVCTEADARAIDEHEARAARQVLPAEDAMDVSRRRHGRAASTARSRRALPVRGPHRSVPDDPPPWPPAPSYREEPMDLAPPQVPEDEEDVTGDWAPRGDTDALDAPHPEGAMPRDGMDAVGPWNPEEPAFDDDDQERADASEGQEGTRDGPAAPDEEPADYALTTAELPSAQGRRRRRGGKRR